MSTRIEILKTYKNYVGGQFPRTESGRYYITHDAKGKPLANVCWSSKKDVRDAVVAARSAWSGWSARSAFNRSQILYRMAEMLQDRASSLIDDLVIQGIKKAAAEQEVQISIDRMIHYAGWCDKYQTLFSTVNPVTGPFYNFSNPEPMGVVTALASDRQPLLSMVSIMLPIIAGGNSLVILASEKYPISAVSLAEVLNNSDLPGGVVNILTGKKSELLASLADHMDVNAVCVNGLDTTERKQVQELASLNVKRVVNWDVNNWNEPSGQSPYFIQSFQETKTTWHPIEQIGGAKAGY
jgi:acyl-CoA reductase-like NAD-dependent aldehyde dehydrogenase